MPEAAIRIYIRAARISRSRRNVAFEFWIETLDEY